MLRWVRCHFCFFRLPFGTRRAQHWKGGRGGGIAKVVNLVSGGVGRDHVARSRIVCAALSWIGRGGQKQHMRQRGNKGNAEKRGEERKGEDEMRRGGDEERMRRGRREDEERSGAERRGEQRRGEERRKEARRGEERRGEKR